MERFQNKKNLTPFQIKLLTQLQKHKTMKSSNHQKPVINDPKQKDTHTPSHTPISHSNNDTDTDTNSVIFPQDPSISVSWTEEIDYLLFQLFMHCKLLAAQHHARYTFFRNRLKRYRIPIIICSALNAYIAVGFQPYMAQSTISTINSVISLFCGILTSIELFLNVQKKMEKELVSYNNFYRLSVDIMKMLWINKPDRKEDGGKFLEKKYNEYLNCIESGNAGRPSQYKNIFEKIGDEYVNKVFDNNDDEHDVPTNYNDEVTIKRKISNLNDIDPSYYNNSDSFPILMYIYRLFTYYFCCICYKNNNVKKKQSYKDYEEYKKYNQKKSYIDIARKKVTKIITPNEYIADKNQEDYDSKMQYVNHQYQTKSRTSNQPSSFPSFNISQSISNKPELDQSSKNNIELKLTDNV